MLQKVSDPAPVAPVTVQLEGELIQSDLRLELLLLLVRENLSAAMRFLRGGLAAIGDMPIHPRALRYNDPLVQDLRNRVSCGEAVSIASTLPKPWADAIIAYLGLTASANTSDYISRTAPTMSTSKAVFKALRLHQWAKNALVFLPLFLAHQFDQPHVIWEAARAFLCFGLVASTIYLVNDMMDLHQDRRHDTKHKRPFASGALPISVGFILVPLLLASAGAIAATLPKIFSVVMMGYVALNVAYTFTLKRKLLVDVMALAGAYILRILAGNAATGIEVSNWLLLTALFVFFSLALLKRYVELDTVGEDQITAKRVMGRGYRVQDLSIVSQMGVSSALAAVMVIALFVESINVRKLYSQPQLLWLVCPVILYLLGRMWVLATRRELQDDPVMFIIKDWRSHLIGVVTLAIFYFAK